MKTYSLILFSALSVSVFAQVIPGDCTLRTGDEKERITTYTVDSNNDTIGMNIWEYHGSIAEWVYMAKEKDKWVFRNKSQRTFDDRGNLLSNLYQEFKNNRWVNRSLDLYSYNDKNNKSEYLLIEYKGKKWTTISGERIMYTYDKENLLTDITYELWNRDAWIKDWRTEFVYNKNILICSYDYEYKENDWKVVFKNEYDWYKWEGNVTASVLRSLNSYEDQNGNWILTKRPHSKRNSSALITYN
jgi:hypothetical protein